MHMVFYIACRMDFYAQFCSLAIQYTIKHFLALPR
jgi:hypothetical protein